MGTTALRHLLKSLCNNSCWNYAVLWKLRPGSPMILTWEDGYFDYPKPREPAQGISENIFCSDGGCILSPLSEVSSSIRSSGECRIGLVVADMLNLWYAFGEGAVGKVACSGIHFWVSFSDILNSEINPEFVSKCPEEWLFQFESGIRTVLLVPVLPHGVLQLGSMEEVTEDIEIVAQIKHRFDGVHWFGDISGPFTPNESTEAHFSSLLMSSPTGYSNTTSRVEVSLVKCEDSNESVDAHSAKLPKDNMLEAQKHESETGADVVQIGLAEISQIESINSNQLDMMESKLFELSYLMEELQQYSDLNGYDLQLFAESLKEIMNTYPDGDMQNPLYGIEAANDVDCRNRNNSLNFPMDCELHKALGSAFQTQANDKFWNLVGDCGSSKMFFSKDFGEITEPSRSARGSDAEYLLEAVIANVCYGPEHPLYISNSLKSSTSQPEHLGGLCLPQNQCEVRDSVGTDSVKLSHFTSSSVTGNTNFTTIDAVNCTMSTVREESPERGYNLKKLQKGQKMPKANRRARPGDKQKPRPRDRQLIQDRVKELRELVPNGAKCSIDGLLDRTIKHMLHLRSVTDQAEKLMRWVHQEGTSRKRNQNGESCANEFESGLQLCPIVVEDLAHPGHMVIEMLCDDRGLFLEIAQVIRDLELTILKGVIETRLNSTWAHFIVEVCKGFHRLDIFWPLMQLWHRRKAAHPSRI